MANKHYSIASAPLVKSRLMKQSRKQVLKVCLPSVEYIVSFETILMEVMYV
tara:strand:+ start:179 stop:331 length:153 start_codon:yes stop_codon:yes gene_type:complete